MTVVLLVVGLLATAAGFVALGFGIPNNAFGLGNTLIVSGTIAAGAGLVLIGLAAVLGQLRRINAALQGRMPPRAPESVEAIVPPVPRMTHAAAPSPARAQAPARTEPKPDTAFSGLPDSYPAGPSHEVAEPPFTPERMRMPETARMPEPPRAAPGQHAPATASEPSPGPLDWLRSKSKAPAMPAPPPRVPVEPPMVDIPDEAPLSPRPPQRPVSDAGSEPRIWSPNRPNTASDSEPAQHPEPNDEPSRDNDGFDLVWPDRTVSGPSPSSDVGKREPAYDMPLPPIPARPREPKPADRRPPAAAVKPAAERGPAILKSGVIDGMPYTLYADGSIEAELSQGTVKFASVDALRAHLEKQN